MADNETLTFEKVWAMFQESDKKFQEQMKKDREQMREQMRKTWEQIWETDRIVKETNKAIGALGNRFGELAEHLVAPSIQEKFKALNFIFERISQDVKISDSQGRCLAEIDILLENGDVVIAVEVKGKPNQEDVDDHIHRMEVLRQKADVKGDTRKFQGAIAGAIMGDGVKNYVHKAGFYLIEQTGDTVRINIPDGFKPREW